MQPIIYDKMYLHAVLKVTTIVLYYCEKKIGLNDKKGRQQKVLFFVNIESRCFVYIDEYRSSLQGPRISVFIPMHSFYTLFSMLYYRKAIFHA